jgi:hypothetical protein
MHRTWTETGATFALHVLLLLFRGRAAVQCRLYPIQRDSSRPGSFRRLLFLMSQSCTTRPIESGCFRRSSKGFPAFGAWTPTVARCAGWTECCAVEKL